MSGKQHVIVIGDSIAGMIKPPTAMFAPTLTFKVMRRMIKRVPPHGKTSDPIPVIT